MTDFSARPGFSPVNALIQTISPHPFPRLIYLARRLNFISGGLLVRIYVRLIFLLRGHLQLPRTDLWREGIASLPSIPLRVSYATELLGAPRGVKPAQEPCSLRDYEEGAEKPQANFDFAHDSVLDSPSIAKIVCSPRLHQTIYDQLRLPFFFTYIGGWVTYGPTADLRANAMAWHVDFDRLLEAKVFVFLDDTAPGSGFQYCLCSHRLKLVIPDGGIIDLPEPYASATLAEPLHPITHDGQNGDVSISLNWGVHRDAPPTVCGRAKVVLELQIGIEPFGISHLSDASNCIDIPAHSAALPVYREASRVNPFLFHLLRFA